MSIDFSNKNYTDLISRFDNWFDMPNILMTFDRVGLDNKITQDQYLSEIKILFTARASYPELPLNEAYVKAKEEKVSIVPYIQSKGLGDTIHKITQKTGLDKLTHLYTSITGKDCGCASRQEALNKLFPYGVTENGV
jgi:hypothetical protein